jgi:hypothetical protein
MTQNPYPYSFDDVVVFILLPLAGEEEDEDVHSLREGTEDQAGSSATKKRARQIFKSPAKKVIFMPVGRFVVDVSDAITFACDNMNHCKVSPISCVGLLKVMLCIPIVNIDHLLNCRLILAWGS